jgi:hypothetical protein
VSPWHNLSIYWDFPILLVVFSLVYSATRHDRWDRILKEAINWIIRITGFLGSIGLGLFVLQRYPDYWVTLAILIGVVVLAVMYGRGIVARPKKP